MAVGSPGGELLGVAAAMALGFAVGNGTGSAATVTVGSAWSGGFPPLSQADTAELPNNRIAEWILKRNLRPSCMQRG